MGQGGNPTRVPLYHVLCGLILTLPSELVHDANSRDQPQSSIIYLAEKRYSSDHTHAVSFPFQVLLLDTVSHGHSGFFQPTLCMEHAHEACHSLPVFLDSLLSNDAHILIGRGENSAPLIVPAVHNVDSPRRGAAAHRYSQHLWYAIRSKLEETLY